MRELSQKAVTWRFLLVALIIPILLAAVGLVLMWSWRDALPDPVAIHWTSSGPDGFSARDTAIWITAAGVAGTSVLITLAVVPFLRGGGRGPMLRAMGATSLWMAVTLGGTLLWSIHVQRGLADATQASGIGGGVAAAFGLGVVAALAGWFLQPAQQSVELGSTANVPVTIAPNQSVVWLGSAQMSRVPRILLTMLPLLLVVVGVFSLVLEGPQPGWGLIGTGILVAVAVALTTSFRVSIGPAGLSVRGALGWPRTHLRLDEIASVQVREVNGFAEFGGWGWRARPDATGIVLRNGQAIWVKRHKGRDLVVTVNDAPVAAGVLQAQLDQR